MKSSYLKFLALTGVAVIGLAGTAQAQIVGTSSDVTKVDIGASTVNGGPHVSGRPGIGVPNTNLTTRVDFQGLQASSPPVNGVTTITQVTGTTTDHSKFGRFDFARVGANDVYFGEWSQTGSATAGDHTVYYAGTATGTTVPTSGAASYSVKGIGDYAARGQLSGTFNANFTARTLTGSISNAAYSVNIGTAAINSSTAAFQGSNASNSAGNTGGKVAGQFFGANAAALAGIVTFAGARQNDTAFGGTRN